MNFSVEHELPGRLRLRCPGGSFTREGADAIAARLEAHAGVTGVSASHRTGGLLIHYEGSRAAVLTAVELLDEIACALEGGKPKEPGEPSLLRSLASMFGGMAFRALLPGTVGRVVVFFRALPLVGRGLRSLWRETRFSVAVLDASAVGVSMLRRDFRTAAVITTLLSLGELLENWTRKTSRESLTGSLALGIDSLWVRRDGEEVRVPLSELKLGDLAVIRAGSVIPVDGVVDEGDAMVNQASMTGESEPVRRTPGLSVYAGTAVEEGELTVRVTAFDNETRISKIAQMIDESEALKAEVQNRAEQMADAIVPYSFGLAGLIYLWTRDAARSTAALLVDYSCALKLSTPLAILSAMREGARRGVLVKGGKFLEALAEADTVVFDKTGTLTVSTPGVAKIVPFGGYTREKVLRTAACLEEHFPHSIARAVVRRAEEEKLSHREEHTTVEYAVAHGIASRLPAFPGDVPGERILLGSAHFVLEDEGVQCSEEEREIIERETGRHSVLFLAAGGRLAGMLCVEDPLREDAREVVERLRGEGIGKVAMLTGDNPRAAGHVAEALGIDEIHAQLLPEDKTEIVTRLKRSGKVIMVGDGINDSPALAAADAGIALRESADIAREAADVVLTENRLRALIDARRLGAGTMRKIKRNYAFIIGVNSLLLVLGLGGTISPAQSALIHNLATVAAGLYSLVPVLGKEEEATE
ncbi:MAG: heavy metal translocating P-type ATPase [Synergistaceae bacterium]|jgi:Cu2+-exporting ATPase|nr:heavy metal translocating P-type ATPase [Synergistaceae bacterium]